MKALVIGSGGREHALAWKLMQSERVDAVLVAPGNAGTALEPGVSNVALDILDFAGIEALVKAEAIDFIVVGPEAPLVAGIVDYFRARQVPIFGPSQAAAQLEGSKAFTKHFLARHGIPTAAYETFTSPDEAIAYIRQQGAPIVVKADGLAAGKGVIVAETVDQAEAAVRDMLEGNSFGDAGHRVVIEDCLVGEEASFIVMVDGHNIVAMASSQDHKRIGDADTGLNTGGMGAYSPAPVVTPAIHERIMAEVIEPTVQGMTADGIPYTGFLYAGLMIAADGTPNVIEFNCRFGDPETQPVLMRLKSDFAELILAGIEQRLDEVSCEWADASALGVVLAAGGYPEAYDKGKVIKGLDAQGDVTAATLGLPAGSLKVFHAGTSSKPDESDTLATNGGRVLCVTALGDSVADAQARAYAGVERINWDGMYCRRDIGYRAVAREQGKG
ncbi:MAG: phosphoribosylamine--glycine ligase [unclassified Hahellaceae]|nr:phosphoribosylamine--glycine ligase [Hahellaceae bacterium]|tara:strand:- start:14599 stop:15930 length:1332 start_codon:yes stop_codon:yes gene_type:complete